jgi:O-antigen ligase
MVAVIIAMQQSPPNGHYGFWRFGASVSSPSMNELSSDRIAIWRDAWDSFLTKPFFGFGEAQFGFVRPELGVAYLHPHNIVLQLLFQWGIVGTAFVGALMMIFIRACRGLAAGKAELVIPAAFVALAIAVYSLFDGALFHTYPVMMFAVSISILVSSNCGKPRASR